MAIDTTKKPANNFQQELIDEGLYPARLARVIELGDQEDKYGVKTKVVLAFTIPSETIEIDGEQKQRMMMTFPLNQTTNPDATLMKYMEALNGTTWEEVIGNPVMIEIKHKVVNGVTRMNINSVSKAPKKNPYTGEEFVVPEPDCDVYIFDWDNPNKEVFEKLSEFRQTQIKSAVNYEGSPVQAVLEGRSEPTSGGYDEPESADEDSPI